MDGDGEQVGASGLHPDLEVLNPDQLNFIQEFYPEHARSPHDLIKWLQ